MTLPGPLPTIRVAIACQDSNLAAVLASLADADAMRVSAMVGSLGDLARTIARGGIDAIVAVDPDAFPPERIMETAAGLPVLVVGPGNDAPAMIAAVEAGALGYADGDGSLELIIEAIRSVAAGVAVIPPLLMGPLLRHVVDRHRTQRQARDRLRVLSVRERQVFELAARGLDKQGVASELFISTATARTHLQNVFRKLSLHSVAEVVALAAECGMELGPIDRGKTP